MANFKVGQKVAFIPNGRTSQGIGCIDPKKGEIVTIKCRCDFNNDAWVIEEYQYGADGTDQAFMSSCLRPLQYSSISKELASKFTEVEEKSDIEIKEPELV